MENSYGRWRNRWIGEEMCLTEGFTATTATVTQCYLQVTVYSFSDILRDRHLSMVFFGCRDLSMP